MHPTTDSTTTPVTERSLLNADEFLDGTDSVAKGELQKVSCFGWTDLIPGDRSLMLKLGVSFFLFGLINNVLYVIILSAALDLVPPSTPKGIIAFCNIAPALVAKVGWPYVLKGRVRYAKRLVGCCLLSAFGMLVVAFFDSLFMRLLGIGLASFSSGLGELTFLQLSTTYAPPSVAGHSVGYFASGTGAAGLVGAFLWWEVRGLGVRIGVGMSSVMPFIIPLTASPSSYAMLVPLTSSPQYYFLLPRPSAFLESYEDSTSPVIPYTSLATAEEELTVCVYTFEYTINQGIAPTLLYPVPSPEEHSFLSKIIHSVRDYYPLWQLVYQTTVFLSRSSISIGIPPLPARLLPLPAILQAGILLILMFESAVGIFPSGPGTADSEAWSITIVFLLISLEGICGGSAYVNVFYRINQEAPSPDTAHDLERTRQEREFKIGSVGFADSSGILFASILAVPMEVALCRQQVSRGKLLCKGL
ncbi:batten's disease protein Cln3 [Mycena olivaceomarginata]|nr:batten's disease protein Cln3 [Mycena olivaceomarginata]